MSWLLLHAICQTTSEAPAGTGQGLRGQRLERIEVGDLAAWVTRWNGERDLRRDDIAAVHALLSRLGDVLPARLPTWFECDEALREAVGRHRDALGEALERVRGRVELGVTVRWRVGTAAAPGERHASRSGTQYLLVRQHALRAEATRRARAEALQAALMRRIGESVVAVEHRVSPSPDLALSSALLVQREAAPSVVAALNGFGQGEEDVRILVHGPWPPYTFAHIPRIST